MTIPRLPHPIPLATPWRLVEPRVVLNQRSGNVFIPWQIVLQPKGA